MLRGLRNSVRFAALESLDTNGSMSRALENIRMLTFHVNRARFS